MTVSGASGHGTGGGVPSSIRVAISVQASRMSVMSCLTPVRYGGLLSPGEETLAQKLRRIPTYTVHIDDQCETEANEGSGRSTYEIENVSFQKG